MATTFDSVLDISPIKQTWRIVVHVIRLWTTLGLNYRGEVNSMEMVLEDKEAEVDRNSCKFLIFYFYPYWVITS